MSTTTTQSTQGSYTEETPTDELRQVFHTEWAQDHLLAYYKIQRKWLITTYDSVGDYIRVWSQNKPGGLANPQSVKEEWRYLPEVTAEIASK